MNHLFQLAYSVSICYPVDITNNKIVEYIQPVCKSLNINTNSIFHSNGYIDETKFNNSNLFSVYLRYQIYNYLESVISKDIIEYIITPYSLLDSNNFNYELNYNISLKTYFICIKHKSLNERCVLSYKQVKESIFHLNFLLNQLNIDMDENKIVFQIN